MKIAIQLVGEFDLADCEVVHRFANELVVVGISSKEIKGQKTEHIRGDLATGVAIASLAISTAGLFVNALKTFWDRQPKYTVTLKRGNRSVSLQNTSRDHALKFLKEGDGHLKIEICR